MTQKTLKDLLRKIRGVTARDKADNNLDSVLDGVVYSSRNAVEYYKERGAYDRAAELALVYGMIDKAIELFALAGDYKSAAAFSIIYGNPQDAVKYLEKAGDTFKSNLLNVLISSD